MSSLRPSVEAERLAVTQRAARHVIAEDARGNADFGTMDVFPPSAGPAPRSGTSEYTWRCQLAWTWAKAGYLSRKVAGDGTSKHWSYALTAEGRSALERIASDPVIASFYVKTKRSSGGDYPVEWYQPPQLVRRSAEPMESVEDGDNDGGNGDVDGDVGMDMGEEFDEEGEEDGKGSQAVDPVSVYFERSTAVLEALAERLVSVEREVKGQTEVLLEAVSRLERISPKPVTAEDEPATRGDVGRAAAEIASALSRHESMEPLRVSVEAMRGDVKEIVGTLAEAVGAVEALSQLADKKFNSLHGAVLEELALGKQKAAEEAAETRAALLGALRSSAEIAGKKLEEIGDKIAKGAAGDSPDIEDVAAIAADLKNDLELVRDDMEALTETSASLQQKFSESILTFRQQMSGISEAAVRVAKMAEELLDGARFVSKEMTSIARERASREMDPEAVLARADAAADKLDALADGIHGMSALGSGLIRPPGGSQ